MPIPIRSKPRKRHSEHRLADAPEAVANLQSFAVKLRADRLKAGHTLDTFSQLVGCSKKQISHIELADNAPSWHLFLRILRVLGYPKPPMV